MFIELIGGVLQILKNFLEFVFHKKLSFMFSLHYLLNKRLSLPNLMSIFISFTNIVLGTARQIHLKYQRNYFLFFEMFLWQNSLG